MNKNTFQINVFMLEYSIYIYTSEIKYTCSLGSLCHSSQLLKRNKYKLCSYPFDWIFSNCINDNDNTYLDDIIKSKYNFNIKN